MTANLIKGSSASSVTGVIGINILDGEKPTIQVIHKSGDTVHCDLYQSADYTQMSVTFSLPQTNQGE